MMWQTGAGLVFSCLALFGLGLAQAPSVTLEYDVIVVGSEPEGVMAAVAAAESGAHTLLITEDPLVGGLFVLGEMNSLDLRTQPFSYQQGLFERWWWAVGRGHSFDVGRAEQTFVNLLREAGVTLRTGAPALSPLVERGRVVGVQVAASSDALAGRIRAPQLIDATAEMDFASAAGARYSFGFEAVGYKERMADTLVFRIDGVDWSALKRGIEARGKGYASVDEFVAWGHFGGYPAAYAPVEPGLRLRGLNLGRQEDGSVLVNALLIYGVDPFDEASVADGYRRAELEAPRIITYLKKELPGFEDARFGGVAERLYIRETRHLNAVCTLSVDDVLDNRVTAEAVAAGGYPLDVQTLTPYDSGFIYGTPEMYGVPLCVTVPRKLDGIWIVGKAAGYDPIAASSARVVPLGMAIGEAVGVAAAQAVTSNVSPAELVTNQDAVARVRAELVERGAYLPPVSDRAPVGPYTHEYYRDFRAMLSRGLAVGGYDNRPHLDAPMVTLSYVYLLSNVGQRFLNSTSLGNTLVERYPETGVPLSAELALEITRDAACQIGYCLEADWNALKAAQVVPATFTPSAVLTRGEMYALASSLSRLQPTAYKP